MSKFVKVMFGTASGAKRDFEYKINEVNVSENWNPNAENGRDFGGFNYCSEECILRWLHRGDTIYDVEIPADAENIKLDGATTIYRTNKIIINNPRKVDDELALHFYKISKIPEKSYYKALGVVSIMNYKQTAYAIFRDKVNKNNIDQVLEEWNDFILHGNEDDRKDWHEMYGTAEKQKRGDKYWYQAYGSTDEYIVTDVKCYDYMVDNNRIYLSGIKYFNADGSQYDSRTASSWYYIIPEGATKSPSSQVMPDDVITPDGKYVIYNDD